MTCHHCGLPVHRGEAWQDCISALRAALQRKELVILKLREACEEAAAVIKRNEIWGGSYFISAAVLTQIQQALDGTKGE